MYTAETTKAGSSEKQRQRRVILQSTRMFLLLKQVRNASASPDPHNKLVVFLCCVTLVCSDQPYANVWSRGGGRQVGVEG